jgi:hypothetical protein
LFNKLNVTKKKSGTFFDSAQKKQKQNKTKTKTKTKQKQNKIKKIKPIKVTVIAMSTLGQSAPVYSVPSVTQGDGVSLTQEQVRLINGSCLSFVL